MIELLTTDPEGEPAARAGSIVMDIVGRGWDTSLILSLLGGRLGISNTSVRMEALYWLTEAAKGGAPLITAIADLQRLIGDENLDHDVANAACLALGLAATNGAPIESALAAARWTFSHDETRYFVVRMAQRAARGGQDVSALASELAAASESSDAELRDAALEALASLPTRS